MSDNGAFQGEMSFRHLSPDEERVQATFALAARAALIATPDPAIGRYLIPELATAAAAGHRGNVVDAARTPARRRRSRLGLVARIAFAVALVPAAFAGLAVAGVNLPQSAQDAFNSVGIDLPNQTDSDNSASSEEQAPGIREDIKSTGIKGAGSGKDKSNPARDRGRGNGAQGRGRALGKRGLAPGHTGTHGNGSQGNGNGKAVGKTSGTPPGQTKVKPDPPGQAKKT